MREFDETLLQIWEQACRHIELEESVAIIEQLLVRQLPVSRLIVLVFGWPAATIRVGAEAPGANSYRVRSRQLSPDQRDALQSWAARGAVLRAQATGRRDPIAHQLLPEQSGEDWLLVPLGNEQLATGVLLMAVDGAAGVAAAPDEIALALREPFSAALENHRRLHELNALREAAEADKRSALTRLGRTELGDTIIGAGAGLATVMQRVALVARSDIPVLILGETGTGKEVIARTIHEHSQRNRGPFIRVNCGAIPADLIDSELFGHEKGAFTGATSARRGWFERADGGTLLLDEVGELSPPAQVRLLRVLQEGAFERVGGEQQRRVDVRIVAATHCDLPAMVQQGRFREDLWYRISGFPIVLPPLRERRADIATLASHFAERAACRFGLRPQAPSAHDIDLLAAYDWPGNIREFQSVIDRATILGDGHSLEVARALWFVPGTAVAPTSGSTVPPRATAIGGIGALDDAMRAHIEQALRACHGRIEGERGVARLLGINPHTLRARMRKLGIDWRRFRD